MSLQPIHRPHLHPQSLSRRELAFRQPAVQSIEGINKATSNESHFHQNFSTIPVQKATQDQVQPVSQPTHRGGKEIPGSLRAKMERAFNTSFSDVKIHEGNHVGSLGAIAYTQGSHIHFAPGQFKPQTTSGEALLGHELAHVVQQRQGRVKPTGQVGGLPLNDNPALEQEADRLGLKAAHLSPAPVQKKPETAHQSYPYQIATPKSSEDGYQEIAALSSETKQPIGRVKIKGSPVQQKMEIASLWVDPDHRQQGISKSLLSAATQEGKKQGYRQAQLGVDPEAPDMSTGTLERIYTRQGFKKTGLLGHSNPLMERNL